MVWKLIHAVLNGKAHFKIIMIFFSHYSKKQIISENNYEYTTVSSLRENKVIHLYYSAKLEFEHKLVCVRVLAYIQKNIYILVGGDLYLLI